MTDREDRDARGRWAQFTRRVGRELARARTLPLMWRPGLRAFLARVPWNVVLLLVGFLVQVVLTWLLWQLVELCIQLMEVWAELARKHLEILLS